MYANIESIWSQINVKREYTKLKGKKNATRPKTGNF